MLHFCSQSNVFCPANWQYSCSVGKGAPVHVFAVLEFLSHEMLKLAYNSSREQRITPRPIDGMHRLPRAHPMLPARTNCAHYTHALCTVHARIVQAARTHCAHSRHALCTLHPRIVDIAGTYCARCTHAHTVHGAVTESGKDAVERKFTSTDNTSNNERLDHMHNPKTKRHSDSVSEHCCSVGSLIVVSKTEGFNHTTTQGRSCSALAAKCQYGH